MSKSKHSSGSSSSRPSSKSHNSKESNGMMKLKLIECKKLSDEIQQNVMEMEQEWQKLCLSMDFQNNQMLQGHPSSSSSSSTSSASSSSASASASASASSAVSSSASSYQHHYSFSSMDERPDFKNSVSMAESASSSIDSTPMSAIYNAPLMKQPKKSVPLSASLLPTHTSKTHKKKSKFAIESIEKIPHYIEKHKGRLGFLEKYIENKRQDLEALSNKHEKITLDIVDMYFDSGERMTELRKKQRSLSSYAQQLARQGTIRNETLRQYLEVLKSIEKERTTMLTHVENPTWEITHHFHMLSFEHFRGNKQAHLLEIAEVLPGRLWISSMANEANHRHEELLVRAAQTDKEREILKNKLQVVTTQRHITQEQLKDLKKMMKIIRKKVTSQRIEKEKVSREKKELNKQQSLKQEQVEESNKSMDVVTPKDIFYSSSSNYNNESEEKKQRYWKQPEHGVLSDLKHSPSRPSPAHTMPLTDSPAPFMNSGGNFSFNMLRDNKGSIPSMDRGSWQEQDMFQGKHAGNTLPASQLNLRIPMQFPKAQSLSEQKMAQRDQNIRMKWMHTLGFHPQKSIEFNMKEFLIELNIYLEIPSQQTKEELEKLDAPPVLSKLQETGALSATGSSLSQRNSHNGATGENVSMENSSNSSIGNMSSMSSGGSDFEYSKSKSPKNSPNSSPSVGPSSSSAAGAGSGDSMMSLTSSPSMESHKISSGGMGGEEMKASSNNNNSKIDDVSRYAKNKKLQKHISKSGNRIAREIERATNPEAYMAQEQLRKEQELNSEKEKEKIVKINIVVDINEKKESQHNIDQRNNKELSMTNITNTVGSDIQSNNVARTRSTGSTTDNNYSTNWSVLKKHFDKYERALFKRMNVQKELEDILNVREALKVAFQQLQDIYDQYKASSGGGLVTQSSNIVYSPNEQTSEKTQRKASA